MATEVELPLVSYDILEYIKDDAGIAYSTLLNINSLVTRYPDVGEFVDRVHKLIALGLIEASLETSEEEGDDYRLSLTKRGSNTLKSLHE